MIRKPILAVCAAAIAAGSSCLYAKPVTVTASDGKSVEVDIPDAFSSIIESRIPEIEKALKECGVDSDTLKSNVSEYQDVINRAYDKIKDFTGFTEDPFATVEDGLNDFCDDLHDAIPNSQVQQNVYAEAWIGKLFPGFHFGAGVNAGVSAMDVTALKDAALALGIDEAGDVPDTLAFPTITADVRLGGIVLPFDIGVTAMSVDSSKLGSVEDKIDPVAFDFFAVGADIRYAIFEGGFLRPKWSVGAGFYYTKGSVDVKDDTATASLDFESKTFMISTQASIKLLCLVPFIGARGLVSKTSADWKATADWAKFIDDYDSTLKEILDYGFLPSSFSGGSSGVSFYPQIYGGIGLDLLFLNITASASYDFVSKLPGAAVSVRIAW